MRFGRWWQLAVLGTAAVLSLLLLLEEIPTAARIGGFAALAAVAAGWVALSQAALRNRPAALALTVILVASCGVGAGFSASFALAQCVVFPLLWAIWNGVRPAILTNIALAASVGVGMFFSLGADSAALTQAAVAAALSLAFSIAIGLWITRVYRLVEQRDALIDQLQTTQDRLATRDREAGATDERERLAREIHDTIAQDLTGIVMSAQRAQRELHGGSAASAAEQLGILEDNARHALAETRALVASGSAAGPDGGLMPALDRLAARFGKETGILVTVSGDGQPPLERDSEVVLLRCAQEALANIRKHASASTATLAVRSTQNDVALSVTDDGIGFDPDRVGAGFGLSGVVKRLALVDGSFQLSSNIGSGTTLVVTLPLAAEVQR